MKRLAIGIALVLSLGLARMEAQSAGHGAGVLDAGRIADARDES